LVNCSGSGSGRIGCLQNPGICGAGEACSSLKNECVSLLEADADGGVPPDMAATDGPAPGMSLSLLAGGIGGAGSADGTGIGARLWGPQGVAADSAGNLYVADTNNHTIRKVVLATGVVTTVAGAAIMAGSADGIGTAARFRFPSGMAVDGAG